MGLNDALGDGNSALRDDLLNQYQQDAPNFSGDAAVLTERLSRKLAPVGPQPSFQPTDFSPTPAETPAPEPEKAPDLSSFGKEVEPEPEPSTADLSSFGTKVPGQDQPLGVAGQLGAAAKGLLRGAPEQASSMLQAGAVAFPTKPVPPDGTALIDQMADPEVVGSASGRAKLAGRFMRTVGDRPLQMDFNAALQRIGKGADPQEEMAALRKRHEAINTEAAGPIQGQEKYRLATELKNKVDAAVPMSDQEKDSIGGAVGTGVGGAIPYVAGAILGGPIAGTLLGAGGMAASTAGSTFEQAKAKGASDEDAAKAAGWGAAIGASLGALPMGVVLRPFTEVSSLLGSSAAAILAQRAVEGAAAFTTVGEAQEYLLTKVAQQYYDPEKGYTPEAKRVIANLITGAVVGAGVHLATRPRPDQLSSPEDIADFLRRAGSSRGIEGGGPIEGEFTDVSGQRGLPGPDTGATPPPEPGPSTPPRPAGGGEAAAAPKTDHQTLRDAGFSEQEIADMSPRARATRLEEASQRNATETPESAIPSSPDKVVPTSDSDVARVSSHTESEGERTGKRDLPIRATTADDVLKASEIVQEPKSPAQAEAENYQHGHLELPHLGLEGKNGISIETGVGQLRKGIGADGQPWEVRMPVAYGRIKGTKGADGQPLDVFIGPSPTSPHVFMIDQRDPATDQFDEHKIMVGFDHPEGAMRAYGDAHDDGHVRIGAVKALSVDEFKDWLANGDHTKRFSPPTATGSEPVKAEPVAASSLTEATAGGKAVVPKETPTSGGVAGGSAVTTSKPRAGSDQPLSLLQFIASKGGMEPHPELKALDLAGDHRVQVPGRAGFFSPVRPTGMPLDQMREAAEEAGYFRGGDKGTSTVRDFLDAIDTELRGQPRHAEGEEGTKSKRRTKLDEEASAHARQSAIDGHVDTINADPDYKHVPDDVKTRAAEIMADESLPLDDAVEQAAMRLVSEEPADYGITPQLMKDTYGEGVSDEIQARPASRNGVVSQPERQEGKRHTGAGEEAEGDGEHLPDTRAESSEAEVTPAHHQAIEDVLGPMAEHVLPADIARAAEKLAEDPDMPPGLAFEQAVAEEAVNQGFLTEPQFEQAYGKDAKELLDTGREGTSGSRTHAGEERAEPDQERAGGGSEDRVISGSGKTGAGAITGSADAGEGDQPDAERDDAAEAVEPETAGDHRREVALQAGDSDEIVNVTLSRKGPWDFNDTWPAPDPKVIAALDKEGRNPFADGDDAENVVGMLDEGMNGLMSAIAEIRGIDERIRDIRSGKTKLRKKQTVEDAIKPLLGERVRYGREVTDTAASYREIFGREAADAMIAESRRRLRQEETTSPEGRVAPPERSDEAKRAAERDAPTWAEVLHALPKDDQGRPDTDAAFKVMKDRFGETAYQNLTPEQKREIYDHFKSPVVYHGSTNRDFTTFGPAQSTKRGPNGDHPGIYFTTDPHAAHSYARGGKVIAAKLDLKNPLDTTDLIAKFQKKGMTFGDAKREALKSLTPENDGIVFRGNGVNPPEYVAFKPEQVTIIPPAGQTTIPGTEPITDGELAQRKADQPLKPKADQRPADDGLFGDGRNQTDLLDQISKPADPLTVYHGTVRPPFEKFDRMAGSMSKRMDTIDKVGIWFTDSPVDAGHFAGQNGHVIAAHLDIKHPLVVDGFEGLAAVGKREGLSRPDKAKDPVWGFLPGDAFRAFLEREGYDGIHIVNGGAGDFADSTSDYWVALNDDQIKRIPVGTEASNGVSTSVSGRDAGSEPENVPDLEEGRGARTLSTVEGGGSAPDAAGADTGQAEAGERPADLAGSEGSGGGSSSDDVRVSGQHADELAGREERAPAGSADNARAVRNVKGENFHIEPGGLQEDRGPKAKATDNVAAIKLAARIMEEDRPATAAEQAQLSRYVGWGGLKNAFPGADGEYGKGFETIGPEIKAILSPEEYDTARRSIQYAHYTSEDIIGAMWKIAQQLGFDGGRVFEPGMGVGNFPGLMPTDLAAVSSYQGVELDHVSARIAKLLYPNWGVRREDFTRMPLPENAFDLAIGNPPFADVAIHSDEKYKQGFLLHDYFFAKSLDAVRPGGVLMFVTSAGTMNKIDAKARDYFAERAALVGAIRLPGNAFKKNAGTEVTTDIVILRKLMPGEASDTGWTKTATVSLPGPDGKPVEGHISSYFAEHPEMVLGKQDFNDKLYEGRYSVKAWDNFDLKAALAVAATKLPRNVMTAAETPKERAEADFEHGQKKNGSFYVKDGTVMQVQNGVGMEVPRRGKGVEGGKSAEQIARIKGLVPIRDALRETYAADLADDKAAGDVARKRLNEAYDGFVKKYGPINKAEIQLRRPSVVQQESARAEAREEARYAGTDWNEGTFDAGPFYDANRPLAEIARARSAARAAAATEGKPFSEGSFDPEDMKDVILDKRPNIEPFMDDQEAYRLRAIEHYDDTNGKAAKGLVFSQNVISRDKLPAIKGVNDAVLYVLNLKGRLDLDAIGAMVNKSKTETIEALGDRIFRVPGTKDTWETKEAYLSGNVRKKLALAKKEAQRDASLRRNVEALEANQPAPLAPAQIHAGLGMPWIPEKVIEDFATKELGLSPFRAKYVPVLAQWVVSGDTDSVAAISTYGSSRRNATALLGDALNHVTPKIYDENADRTRVLNIAATQEAQDKLQTLKDKFKRWVFADDERADPLAAYYNEHYNNLVVRQYDGSYLTTPGVASDWKWRPHQTRVIARIIQDGNTYMAHAVGAGKTSAMIGAGMEMRRLGLVKKPMFVVPNHMLAQFTKEFYEQYPTARIAVADDRNFHADRRKQFMANVALEDLDAVIITHTNFGMIPVSDEFSDSLIQEELERYRNALAEMPKGGDNRITRSRVEKQIERLEQRLSGKNTRRRDNVFTFDEMGVDFVFVDEAQEFRKLDFTTQMSNLKGITPEGSGKAWDLYVKTKLLEKRNPGRNLVLASGTPVTNTMAELYTVSRYLQPHELAERGLSAFDAWAGAFGEEVSELEQDAAGGYKPVSRFARFVNVAELSAMVRQTMDVVTSRQLEQYVTRPKIKGGKRQMHLAEKSPELASYQDGLAARMVAIKGRGKPKPGDDIMLTIIGDGRHAAIDMRLVGAEPDPDYPSKLEMLIDNVWDTAQASKKTNFYRPRDGGYDMSKPVDVGPATQMVFANLGISAKRGLPVHEYIRSSLVRRGMARDQIAIISDYKNHVQKQKLFNDMNSGKVRVLIGSVAKMGTGVNAQRRLIAVHNLDPLWFPSDDEQRNGRILRQGNWNPEIAINDYSTKGTYDSTMWGLMEKKARFIQGFFEGDPSMRDMDDLGEASQYAQAKALTTNDPRLMRLTELKQDLERAERRKQAFESERFALKRRRAEAAGNVDHYGARVAAIKQDIKAREDISGDKFTGTIGKKVYDKRVDFGEAILDQLDKLTVPDNANRFIVIGEIGGFPLRVNVRKTGLKEVGADLLLKRNDADSTVHGTSALGIVRSIESIMSGFESDQAYAQQHVDQATKFLADSEGKGDRQFEGNADIATLLGQVMELEAELSKKDEPKGERPAPTEEDRATLEPLTEAGAAKRAQLEKLLTDAVHAMVPTVQIKFHDGRIPLSAPAGGWGDVAARYKGAIGLYRPAKQLIELSFDSGTPISAAFHEAYHAIEHLLQTVRERDLMVKETPRIRQLLKKGIKTWTAKEIDALDGAEVRAIGFEVYRRERDRAGAGQGLHVGVKRWYHRLSDLTRRIRNGVNGLGFQTAEDIFEKAFDGGFADRQPPLLGTPYPQATDDTVRASIRNPFNGPLRDSLGEELEAEMARPKEKFIERYQNLSRPVQKMEEIIEARMAGELPDSQAFYQKKRLYPGKVAAEAADFNRDLLDPFVDFLKEKGISREEAGDILYALHAFERNREMDRINMGDLHRPADVVLGRGSGMSDDTADTILKRYPPQMVNEIDRLAGKIRDFINTTMVSSGLESPYTVQGWQAMYQHYVPLSGWEDAPEDAPSGYNPKLEVRGPEVRKAFGRKSKADNPLVNLIDQAYRTIERAKKNEYDQSIDNALHELEPDDLIGFARFDQGLPRKEINKRTGLVRVVDGSNLANDPGAVGFKRGGNQHYIIFENKEIADAVKRMHADGLGVFQKVIDIQNKLKATWTHYSPEFLLRHFLFRYPIEGTLNSFEQKEAGPHSVGRYIADSAPFLGRASKAIFASNKGQVHSDPAIAELQRYWEEMRKAGGAMMFRQMRDTNLLREHMRLKLNSLSNSKFDTMRQKWHAGVEAMDVVTNALDNALRLAAFASARKQGKTIEEAAVIARDATVDFQMSGRWKNAMSIFAPFAGVAINTGARMTSAIARSRMMRQVFGATVLAGFLSGMFNYLIGGDDKDGIPFADKLAWWEKGLTFTLINPFDRDAKDRPQPIHIPMPYNWAFPLVIGQAAAAIVFGKDKHHVSKAMAAVLKSGFEALTPFGAEHNMVAQITPELLRPLVHAYTNESWNGVPVHQDPAFQKGPRSASGRKTTGEGWKLAAGGLNAGTGGDAKHSGVVDVYPEDLRDVLSYYSGTDTIMRFGRNVMGSVGHVAAGEPQEPSRIPFARVVRGADYDAADKSRMFERRREQKRPWEQ